MLKGFGFSIVREKEHISMVRQNADGTTTPLTMPNHNLIKGSTLFVVDILVDRGLDKFVDIVQDS